MDFGETVCSEYSGLCCGWILDYKLMWKNMAIQVCIHCKAYFNVLFGSEYIVNGYHAYENGSCFRCCKYVVGLLWHSSIWNFLMKNKEKNQAHEELRHPWISLKKDPSFGVGSKQNKTKQNKNKQTNKQTNQKNSQSFFTRATNKWGSFSVEKYNFHAKICLFC